MQSTVIAMLVPERSGNATMVVRRGDGRFILEQIDARVAAASRLAAKWLGEPSPAQSVPSVSLG